MLKQIRVIDGHTALLHAPQVQRAVNQLIYMGSHSSSLLGSLDALIERTEKVAPQRCGDYKLDRPERRNPVESQRERLLEKAIWKRWNRDAVKQHRAQFQGALCHHIQTFQMPLKEKEADKSWGRVDLVGVSGSGLPVVLELKQEESSETPLRMLVEGLAYAIAVRKAWNEGVLRKQWERLQSNEFDLPVKLKEVPVIGIAPSAYWNKKIGSKDKRLAGRVPESAWKPFGLLCDACSDRGFPISFLQFEAGEPDSTGLPTLGNPIPVSLFVSADRS